MATETKASAHGGSKVNRNPADGFHMGGAPQGRRSGRPLSKMRPGAVAAEFAVVFPLVIFPLMVATIDLGDLLHTRHVLTNAAREGVAAVVRGDPNYRQVVTDYVSAAGLDGGRVRLSGPTYDPYPPVLGSEVTLRVTLAPYEFPIVPWGGWFPNVTQVSAGAVMRHLQSR